MRRSLLPFLALASLLAGCSGGSGGGGSTSTVAPATSSTPAPATSAGVVAVVLEVGPEIPAPAAARFEALLRGSSQLPFEVRVASAGLADLGSGSLVIGLGETAATRAVIPAGDVAGQGPEGFVVRAADLAPGVRVIAAEGNAQQNGTGHGVNRGALYGAYALFEELGFAFLHPLAPTIPTALSVPPARLELRERPRWPHRGIHLHTMHPIELTDLLNGWGPGGPQDLAGWQAMLPEWDLYLEWLLANRQNEVEWVILSAKSWEAWGDGPDRLARLKELVARGQRLGIDVGLDVPLALAQQHSWRLVRHTGTLADEVDQIERRLDYVLAAGFDTVTTELGFSEFTKPDDQRMLDWLNAFGRHLQSKGVHAYAKAHVSQGQTAKNFPDPRTGQPINFNFLTHFADPSLGVMAHTVQHYGLDDPAPTYGATDFAFIRDFLHLEAGTRPTIWYPETAYWVSFDIDVPLFLPVYAQRRVHDLRLIAGDEAAGRMQPMDGQMIFSSGWEWGYWLNDVVAARAAWDPHQGAASDDEALRALLAPAVRPFGAQAAAVRDRLVQLCADQKALLIEGAVAGRRPAQVEKRNAQAYLQGWETWDDVAELAALIPGITPARTQPSKRGLVDLRRNLFSNVDYGREIRPLLRETADTMLAHADALEQLAAQLAGSASPGSALLTELDEAMRVTSLRSTQVFGLYDYVDRNDRGRLTVARDALDRAALIVKRREAAYRVPADRIAGWRDNPTAYRYGYLWTARTLHFWWRDEGKAVDAPWSPAYLNTIDPLDVAFGEGFWIPLADMARLVGNTLGAAAVTDLLAAPAQEPTYPPPGLRQHP
ncbi:MAG: hypothetical protein AB7N76_35725 [Planctomycetota bacterium]